MANELLRDNYAEIAAAIREKTGSNNLMSPSQMPDEIRSISTGITPRGTYDISDNGNYLIRDYEYVDVKVESGEISWKDNTEDYPDYFDFIKWTLDPTDWAEKEPAIAEAIVIYDGDPCYFETRYCWGGTPAVYHATSVADLPPMVIDIMVDANQYQYDSEHAIRIKGTYHAFSDSPEGTYIEALHFTLGDTITVDIVDNNNIKLGELVIEFSAGGGS